MLIPVFMVALLGNISHGDLIAVVVFSVAAATDSLDGYLARSRQSITTVGKLLDPLADKLLISAALISLVELDRVAAWVAMVIIAREFAVTGLRLVAAAEDVIMSAGRLGKAKAFSQNVALAVIMLDTVPAGIENTLLYIAVALTVISGAHYFIVARWRRSSR